jgi:HAMP domain-containing protein
MDVPSALITSCDQCGKAYQVDFSRFNRRYGKFQCKSCTNWVTCENPDYISTMSNRASDEVPAPEVSQANIEQPAAKVKVQGLSIQLKITLILVLLVVGAISAVGLAASLTSRKALLNEAEQRLRLLATQKAQEYNLVFQRMVQEVEGIADFSQKIYGQSQTQVDLGLGNHLLMPWTGEGYGSEELDRTLGAEKLILQQIVRMVISIVQKNPYVTLGYLGTETNIMALDDLEAVTAIGSRKGFVNTRRPWYVKAKEEGKTIWSAPYVDANTGDLIVTCAAPVYDAWGRLIGVVGFDVLLATIQKDILTMDIGYNSYAMLIDANGKVLVRPGMDNKDIRWDKTYATEDLLHTENRDFNNIIGRMLQGQKAVESYTAAGGANYIAYAPMPGVGGAMAIVTNQDEVVKPATAIQTFIIIICIVGLVVAVAVGIFVGGGITRPINNLTAMADSISKGETDLEIIPEQRKDEIGVLIQAFNRLVISLKIAISR